MTNPSYSAGYLLGKRDGRDMVSPQRVCHKSKTFQDGYSDGYHKGSGGLVL